MNEYNVRSARPEDLGEWLRMRLTLWPEHTSEEMAAEMQEILSAVDTPVFVAQLKNTETLCGFLEGGMRKYGEGCETSPVGYIEGWYVDENWRRKGVGRRLVLAFEEWARRRGLTEIGSDTWQDNQTSIDAHAHLGYAEVQRLVHFAKKL